LLDADDRALPHRLAVQLECIADATVGAICSGAVRDGGAIRQDYIGFDTLWDRNVIPTSSVLLRRTAWEAMGGFDERRDLIGVEDYNLWLRLTHAGWRIRAIPGPLVEYLPTAASLTRQRRRFVAAELANLRTLAESLELPAESVRQKEYRIRLEYGIDFFHQRDFAFADEYLGTAAKLGPLPPAIRLRRWIAAIARHVQRQR
jgi:hypothetical protein